MKEEKSEKGRISYMVKKISMKEIAKLSGVSVATVSRVINNNGRFSEETRQHVEKVMREHGYTQNFVAKSLRMQKSYTVGILVPDIENVFFAKVVKQLETTLFDRGYSTIICNTDRNEEKEISYLQMLEGKMIDGLVVISGKKDFDPTALKNKIPVICIDRKPINTNASILIQSDHENGGYLATKSLIEKQCKHIVILVSRSTLSSTKERLAGFKKALVEAKIPFSDDNIISLNKEKSYITGAEQLVIEKLQSNKKVDGIFAVNDRLAIGALRATQHLGLKVPEDIKIIGFDDDPITHYTSPHISSVRQNTDAIAEVAATYLLKLMELPDYQIVRKNHIIPVELIQRETT